MFIDHLQNTRTKWWDLFDTESNYIDHNVANIFSTTLIRWLKEFHALLKKVVWKFGVNLHAWRPFFICHLRNTGWLSSHQNIWGWNDKKCWKLKYQKRRAKNWKGSFFGKNCEISCFSNRRHNLTNLSIKKSAFFLWLSLLLSELITVTISFLVLFYLSWYLCFKSRLYYTLIL